jgi:cell division septation protein DedD
MVSKLRGEGYDAFVMPVKSGTNTLYRVRIGPMADRESAASTLSRIKAKVPAAAVVKHP